MEFHGRDLARKSRSQTPCRTRSPLCFSTLPTFGQATTTFPTSPASSPALTSPASPWPLHHHHRPGHFPRHTWHEGPSRPDNTCQSPPLPGIQDTCACGRWCSERDTLGTSGTFLPKVVPRTGHLRHFRAISAEGGALNGTPSALSRTALTPFTATTQTKRPCPCFRDIEICPLHGAGFDGGNDLRKESAPGAHLSFIQIHIEETGRWAENRTPFSNSGYGKSIKASERPG